MGTEGNLIRGPLDIYVGPLGEALPELDDLAPPAKTITVAGNWVQIGFTVKDNDFELTYTPSFEDIWVNEATAPVDAALDKEEGGLGYMAAEHDFTAWSQIMHSSTLSTQAAGADQTGQDIIGVGHPTTEKVMKSLLLVGLNPEAGSRVIHVYKARSVDPAVFAHGRKHTGVPVVWRFYEDTTKTAGEKLFKPYDIVAVATS